MIRTAARQVSPLQALVTEIYGLVQNEDLTGDELRASIVALIKPFRSERWPFAREMATQWELCVDINDLSRLLAVAADLEPNLPANHPLAEVFAVLDVATNKELTSRSEERLRTRVAGVRSR